MRDDTLRITEKFYSLQGETKTIGLPTYFIRLTGCPLRCDYCDTEYAFHGGQVENIGDIVAAAKAVKAQNVCVTGGEPMAQPNVLHLMTQLCDEGMSVSIETSGSFDIREIDTRVSVVMDVKTPDSNESSKNRYENISLLQEKDQIKFVICSRQDYDWAKFKLDEYTLADKAGEVIFSPSFTQLDACDLADWIIEDNLPVRFQLQLHKLLWADEPGH